MKEALAGDEVVVTNGVYGPIGVGPFVTVRSLNGPGVTVIEGAPSPISTFFGLGIGARRCAHLNDRSVLNGFTLTNGYTDFFEHGGGAYCEPLALLTNCVVINCRSGDTENDGQGGGVYQGILDHCWLIGNVCNGEGGGAASSTLINCVVSGNISEDGGGGVAGGTLYNCLLTGNRGAYGGGAFGATMYQCTIVSNSPRGTYGSTLDNCIAYHNGPGDNHVFSTLNYSCTFPQPTNGTGNITNEPAFVNAAAGDYRLRPGSPCIDAGTNLSAILINDLDGNPRPRDGNGDGITAFDMGAYEFGVAPGAVVAWGGGTNNTGIIPNYGQSLVPVAAQNGVTAIAAGFFHTVALTTNGSVLAWGINDYGQATIPVTAQGGVMAIAAGAGHTVALKNDGSVIAWGDFCCGQMRVPVAAQSGVTAIAAGDLHTVALKNDGSVLAWLADGNEDYGQTNVPAEALSGVVAIAAGHYHTVALKNDGSVLAWGQTNGGKTIVPVAAQSGVTAIAAGEDHTVALKNDGSVVAWGDNVDGQTTVPVAAQSGVIAIAAGASHTVALKSDGSVVAWGFNGDGQTTVPMGAQSGVTAIAAGASHTVAIIGNPEPFQARRSGDELILTWSTNGVGFTLQSTLDLTPPATWADVTNAPALLGGQWAVTNSFSGSAKFYRLRKL